MLVSVQVPFADLRAFRPDAAAVRLARPQWPVPVVGHEFVRRFGVVRRHPRGGIKPWSGEEYFCDAARTLTFVGSPRVQCGHRITPRSRRLFTNGKVGRVEVELRAPRTEAYLDVAWAAANLCVRVSPAAPQPLLRSGGSLARAYERASTPIGPQPEEPGGKPRPLVVPTSPLALVELGAGRRSASPAMRDPRAGLLLEHTWIRSGPDELPVWVLKHGPDTPRDAIRRVRAHAMRLHCELDGFAAVLRACRTGVLDPGRSGPLRDYLHTSATRLLRNEYDGLPQAELLQYVARQAHDDQEGRLASLEETFAEVSPSLRRLIGDVEQLSEAIGPAQLVVNLVQDGGSVSVDGINVAGSNNTIGSGNTSVGSNTSVSGVVGSHNQVAGNAFGDASSGSITELADLLVAQLRPLRAQLSGVELDLAETVAEDVRLDSPPTDRIKRFLRSILDGVRTLGESAAPAVATIASIQEILG